MNCQADPVLLCPGIQVGYIFVDFPASSPHSVESNRRASTGSWLFTAAAFAPLSRQLATYPPSSACLTPAARLRAACSPFVASGQRKRPNQPTPTAATACHPHAGRTGDGGADSHAFLAPTDADERQQHADAWPRREHQER
ncbi:hypothetical protein GQ600_2463 [Phytophthora cactorum]|nr:hypothetical protein GQ600_2463 [Phytophthora cactorum]